MDEITFHHLSDQTHSSRSIFVRMKPALEALFQTISEDNESIGILVGGAASVLLGCPDRYTKDMDINVTKFPDYSNHDPKYLLARPGRSNEMTTITYLKDKGKAAVKCDMSTKRADTVLKVYEKYTVTTPQLEGVVIAGPCLLLADKIRTFAERRNTDAVKKETDILDIAHCLELMFDYNLKMDPLLRSLYTSDQWKTVRSRLESTEVETPGEMVQLFKDAEAEFEIIV